MADQTGHSPLDIIESLKANRLSHSFFQIRRLIERYLREKGLDGEQVRVQPSLSTAYPTEQLIDVSLNPEENRFELLTSFLGLYGVSSPLPGFYTDELLEAQSEDLTAARDLIDIIHQRLYALLYEVQTKYRPVIEMVEGQSSRCSPLFFNLLGIDPESIPGNIHDPHRLLRYISLFSLQPRSALGLKTILEDALTDIDVEVEQCSSRKVKIPENQRITLGKPALRLGQNAILGEELEDKTGKIVIRLGPLEKTQFQDLMNGSEEWTTLVFLTQSYLNTPFDCDIEFILKENQAEPAQLGNPAWSSIGNNTWLFSGENDTQVHSRYVLDISQKL